MATIAAFATAVGFSNIGAFVVEAFGLAHLLSSTAKGPVAIMEQAREELCAAFDILDQFYLSLDEDLLALLVERYEGLHERLVRAESEFTGRDSVQSKSFKESLKTRLYNLKKREAKKTLVMCHKLFIEIRAASEDVRLTKLKKEKNWITESRTISSAMRPGAASEIPVPPCVIKYDFRKTNIPPLYPPTRAGSLASIVSNPFKDPPGVIPPS